MSSRLSQDYSYRPQPTSSSSYQNQYPRYPQSQSTSPPVGRPLYYEAGEDRDQPFDVRADFDGDGPRWSERYGGGGLRDVEDKSYYPVDNHVAPTGLSQAAKAQNQAEEMVSVPVLGPEWTKNELHELSRRGQAEVVKEKRSRAWKAWTRDQRGMCGVKWLTRRLFVFLVFFFCAALGVTLFFVIPRNPGFAFYTDRPFDVDNSTVVFSRTPANYSFSGNLNIFADASNSWLPVQFNNLEATLYDLLTQKAIATGNLPNFKIPNKQQQPIIMPVTFSYSALNASDTTWLDMYQACGHMWPGTTRPDLKFRLIMKSSIVGLVTKPEMSTQISDVACPFELPVTSV